MQAILMTRPGGPELLEARSMEKPELPSPHHILVRPHAAGVNPVVRRYLPLAKVAEGASAHCRRPYHWKNCLQIE